jgi:hypothetical protein
MVKQLPTRLRVFCCIKMNQMKYIQEELERLKKFGPSPAFLLNSFRNGDCFKMGHVSKCSSNLGEIFSAHFTVWQLPMQLRVFCCIEMNQIKYILKELEKTKRLGPSPAFQLNSFRNGNCFKMGYAS